MKKIFIAILLILPFVISCEKDADEETPGYTPKLVIHSFISPNDTVLKVHVSTNKNVFGKQKESPKFLPVQVTLFDEEKEMHFSQRDTSGYCSLKYNIIPGREYRILAKCAGYPDASAKCKVPFMNNISIFLDTLSEYIPANPSNPYISHGYYNRKATLHFMDVAGEKNYYNIGLSLTSTRLSGDYTQIIYPDYEEMNYFGSNLTKLLSDNLMDGKKITLSYQPYYSPKDTSVYAIELNASVLETDFDYYKYHTSLKKYSGTSEPFTEYSPVYSNVSGGLGIFASYVWHKRTLKLK